MKFEEYFWHDSEIRRIEIDRTCPGKKDAILFEINWIDTGLGNLIFEDVYWASINMNFGILAPECIDSAFISENDDDLNSFFKKWGGQIDDIELFCYTIKTISTGSEMKIIAKGFKVIYE